MPKILSDNGVEFHFEQYDILTSGDIFVHNISKRSGQNQYTHSTIDSPASQNNVVQFQPKLELSEPVVRIAQPPAKKNRLGIMCPKCHQSRSLIIPDSLVVVSKLKNEREMMLFQLDKWNEVKTYDVTTKYDLIKFLCESDLYISSCVEGMMNTTLEKLVLNLKPDSEGICTLCDCSSLIQDWINEFYNPKTEFFHTCRVCGGEMSIQNAPDLLKMGSSIDTRIEANKKSSAKVQTWKCDNKVCNYTEEF